VPVNSPRREYSAMLPRWQRARDCFEGSDAVKAAGAKYLPMLDSHKNLSDGGLAKYEEYKYRALFYNATGRTVEGMAGALFQIAPIITVPSITEEQMEDVTLNGTSAELFGLQVTRDLVLTGRYGILIDFPVDAPGGVSAAALRPYWIGYRAEDIIAWRTERWEGREVITGVVLFEIVEERDGKDDFVMNEIEQYRALELVKGVYTQNIWRKIPNSDQFLVVETYVPTRRGVPLPFIPFTFLGSTSTSSIVQKPPLDDLVIVNLSHYCTMADLEHGRHYTALPTPWVAGALGGKTGAPLYIGSGKAWSLEKEGRAGMLEFSGAGLGHLAEGEREKRKMMATLGARLLEDQASTNETATAVLTRHSGEQATLRTIAQAAEAGLSKALRFHVWWEGADASPLELKEVQYTVNKEFFSTKMSSQELQGLVGALQAEAISYETFYDQLVKGEIARPGVTAEQEQEAILVRSAALQGALGPVDPNAAPPDPNIGEVAGDRVVATGDWWKLVERKKKFVLLDNETGETLGTFDSQKKAQDEVRKIEEQG